MKLLEVRTTLYAVTCGLFVMLDLTLTLRFEFRTLRFGFVLVMQVLTSTNGVFLYDFAWRQTMLPAFYSQQLTSINGICCTVSVGVRHWHDCTYVLWKTSTNSICFVLKGLTSTNWMFCTVSVKQCDMFVYSNIWRPNAVFMWTIMFDVKSSINVVCICIVDLDASQWMCFFINVDASQCHVCFFL